MGKLSTHVLDTAAGRPAAGVIIDLFILEADGPRLLKTVTTNADGRSDELLLDATSISVAQYELVFKVGAYFESSGVAMTAPPFLSDVPVRFGIADTSQNYHVPLLISPWSYSTYRGS